MQDQPPSRRARTASMSSEEYTRLLQQCPSQSKAHQRRSMDEVKMARGEMKQLGLTIVGAKEAL